MIYVSDFIHSNAKGDEKKCKKYIFVFYDVRKSFLKIPLSAQKPHDFSFHGQSSHQM